jgi:large repetitive protein
MNKFIRRTLIILSLFVFAFGTSFSPVKLDVFAAKPGEGAALELSIDKFDVLHDYDITYQWTLTKTASPTLLTLSSGGSGDVLYTVSTVKTQTSTFSLTYNVTVVNKGTGDVRFDVIASIINPSGSVVYTSEEVESDKELLDGATFTQTYTTEFALAGNVNDIVPLKIKVELSDMINVASVKISGTQPAVNFKNTATNINNPSLTVTDSWAGAGPWTFTETGSVQYTRTFNAGAIGDVFENNTVTSNTLVKHDPAVLTASAQVTVRTLNSAPVADPDSFTVNEGATYNGTLTGSDPDGQSITFFEVSGPMHGLLTINENGTFEYIHDGSETTSDSFTFRVFDGTLYSPAATVNITVNPVNDAPVANPDSFTVNEGGTFNGTLTGSDPEDDELTFSVVDLPLNGSLVINADGTFTYIHDGSETLSDSFTFRVYDGQLYSTGALVKVTINSVNDAPVADPDEFTVDEGATFNGTLTGSDAEDDELMFYVVDLPMYGTLVINTDGTFEYVHDGSETTADSFTFRVFDGELYSEKALVEITINPVNDAPVADPDEFTVNEGDTFNGLLSGSDAEDDELMFYVVDLPMYGTLVINTDGTFEYVHDGSETTADSFTFRVFDGALYSEKALVEITINPVNDAPVADPDEFTVDEGATFNGLLTGSDAENDKLLFYVVDLPAHGSLVIDGEGEFVYIHDGSETTSDSFTFRVFDGALYSEKAIVEITINPVNDAPIADDDAFVVDQGEEYVGLLTGSDAEDDELEFILVDGPDYGVLVLNADGTFSYTHDDSENYDDSFTFKVNDGSADSNIANVTIEINATLPDQNAAPVADDYSFDVDQGEVFNGMVTGSDEDEDDELVFILVTGPVYGTLVFNADGSFTYTHDDSENYDDSFTFKVNDGEEDSEIATVTIEINATLPDTSDNNSGLIGLGALALGLILLLVSKKKEAKN